MSQEDILRKVRGLLAKADGTDNPHEADAFRAKAESMMLKYSIEQWQLSSDTEQDNSIGDAQYDFSFYARGQNNEILGWQWVMFLAIARHCRIKVITWKPNWSQATIPIVGTSNDRAYFDLLFTTCLLEMGKGLEPEPDPKKPFAENVAILKESGQQWLRIAEQLHQIGQLPKFKTLNDIAEELHGNRGVTYANDVQAAMKKQVHNLGLATVYTKFCDETGRPRLRVTPKMYQRSFAAGFSDEISRRLRAMRKAQTTAEGNGSGMELVLADISTRVNHKAIELYGNPPQSSGRGGRGRQVQYAEAGLNAGAAAASRVDLGGSGRITGKNKELSR